MGGLGSEHARDKVTENDVELTRRRRERVAAARAKTGSPVL